MPTSLYSATPPHDYVPPWWNAAPGIAAVYGIVALLLIGYGVSGIAVGTSVQSSLACSAGSFCTTVGACALAFGGMVAAYAMSRRSYLGGKGAPEGGDWAYVCCACCVARCGTLVGGMAALILGSAKAADSWGDERGCHDGDRQSATGFVVGGWMLLLIVGWLLCCLPTMRDRWELQRKEAIEHQLQVQIRSPEPAGLHVEEVPSSPTEDLENGKVGRLSDEEEATTEFNAVTTDETIALTPSHKKEKHWVESSTELNSIESDENIALAPGNGSTKHTLLTQHH